MPKSLHFPPFINDPAHSAGAEEPWKDDDESLMSEVGLELEERSSAEWGESRTIRMVGRHPRYVEMQRKLQKLASFDEAVLVTGESGVGKESVAQSLHLLGNRSAKNFVSVNCPQFRDGDMTVSELFGHKKGSFTGAISDRKGCFENADGGSIFLDEVGDLHMSAQVMLLRALATGEFQPLGSNDVRRVNVRVVAATNRPLDGMILGEEFREDLYYRLRYFHIEVPPLRKRGNDWYLLVQHFLEQLHQKYGQKKRFSTQSLRLLEKYRWPGNVRELISVATIGYAMSDGDTIRPHDFRSLLSQEHESVQSDADLYEALAEDGQDFWEVIHAPFLARDLNRAQVREVVRLGLEQTGQSYRKLLDLFGIRSKDYQKLMDFLRHHRLKP